MKIQSKNKQEQDVWFLPQSMELKALLDTVVSKFASEVEQPQKESFTYFDTFDWRLYERGFYLQHLQGKWLLTKNESTETMELSGGPNHSQRIFPWDFPIGQLRTRLESILEVRALLPLTTIESTTTPVRILNKDDKTVCFLFFQRHLMSGAENALITVRLEGVRGYNKQKKNIHTLLHSQGIVDPAPPRYDFKAGLVSTRRVPGDYNSKFSIQLDPNFTARQAMVAIYKQLLAAMRCNEEGIIKDLDSEFLHDFRVAIRRTRSGLSLIKNVLPLEITNHFKTKFSHLGSITGPTRDLDVYLLYENNYKSRLPPTLQGSLHTFFMDLATRRAEEQKKLARAMKSSRYSQTTDEWEQYLEGNDETPAENADTPVIDIARKTIFRRYKKIMKDGMAISELTPDENLHRLRIQGKKLRYSLEFFASLFPKAKITRAIKQLKRLQNNLGDFNDLSVQQEMLHHYLNELRPSSRKNFELATAIGGLLTNLYHEQNRKREDFHSIFDRFSSSKNVALYNELFNTSRPE